MKTKKKLLFVIPSLNAGGGEKSLINLLNQLDYKQYKVDLLLFRRTGEFLQSLPQDVTILDLSNHYYSFAQSLLPSMMKFISKGNLKFAYSRLLFTLTNRFVVNASLAEQYSWKYKTVVLPALETEYDVAIGYLEKSSIYFVVDKVKAKRKIGWIHTNYSNAGMDPKFDRAYFEKLDQLVTVSEECKASLLTHFNDLGSKIRIIENILSPNMLKTLSEVEIDTLYQKKAIKIVTLARLSHEKGIDLAIEACKELRDQGYLINWLVLGEGTIRQSLKKQIKAYDLEKNFRLLGVRTNPYPYIKHADLYVQPSRYEGKSMAIEEAKILNKPIVITDFETAKDTLINEQTGLIVEKNGSSIANGIIRILVDSNLRNRMIHQLSQEKLGTEDEVQKVYAIL